MNSNQINDIYNLILLFSSSIKDFESEIIILQTLIKNKQNNSKLK